jgi:hypothetical protein
MTVDWKTLLAPVIVVSIVVGLYLPSLQNPLVWDDVTQIERVRNASMPELASRAPGEEYLRPMVLLSYRAQMAVGLDHPSSYHAINIFLHALNAALLLLLLRRLGLTSEVALPAAILFAVHPLQSAAVAYVSGRTDLLALTFTLLAIVFVLATRTSGRAASWAVAAALAAFASALSNEVGLVAPLLGAAACRVTLSGDKTAGPAPIGVPLAMAVAGLVALWFVFPDVVGQGGELSLSVRLRAMGTTLMTFGRLFVVPTDLHLDRLTATGGPAAGALGALALGAFVPAIVVFFFRPQPWAFGLLALALSYGPASGFIPVYPRMADQWIFTPEHALYVPIAAVAPLVVCGIVTAISRSTSSESVARVSTQGLLVVAAILTAFAASPIRERQHDLSSEVKLYRSIVEHSPSPRACFNLGVALLESGDHRGAIRTYEKCIVRHPRDAGMISQLGVAYQLAGDPVKARSTYAAALALLPDDPLLISNLASLDASMGLYADARRGWARALVLQPDFQPARDGLRELEVLETGDQ